MNTLTSLYTDKNSN